MMYVSCITAVILISAGIKANPIVIILGGLFEGTLLTITPALCQPFMKKLLVMIMLPWDIQEILVML